MTDRIYRTEAFDKAHRHSGGIIYPLDFNTNYRARSNKGGSPIAARIEADFIREQERGVWSSANLALK